MSRWIELGVLLRPHGIKGEICVDWYADSPSLLSAPLFLQQGNRPPSPVKVAAWRMHKERPLILLEGVGDRTAAENLRGARLLVDRDSLPPTADDEVYVEDLLGCAVLLPDGSRLGSLDHVEYPAPDKEIWSIRTPDGKEVLFPAEDCFIMGFDLADPDAPVVTIDPPPGLLDVYLNDAP
ncbi:MAG TPA: ribosome maturation factor RimM [Candidatus Desulfovibrio intestinavium]|uniref:Ribosome maturation factor RimM n=1 Tax=Candidatus Desulfovibrio intestinavium TaxID=2838534 RepID=A0A9D2KPQ3_9BACT|nr:ribosome maturation factor RimM [Candidatus Desulfovibrio intestinavium]